MVLAGLAISVIRFRPQLFGSRLSGFFAFGRGGRGNQPTVVVDYYVRFARICGRHGLFRGPSQTQREFARQIATVLEDRLAPAGLTLFPVDLTELFYRERFQSAALDASVRASVFGKLAQFEAALSRRNGRTVALGRVKQP